MKLNMKFILLFSLLFLTSCGLKQVVIPNLDLAIEHKLRKDMKLTYTQQKLLAHDIDIMLNKLSTPTKNHLYPLLKDFKIEHLNQSINTQKYANHISEVYFSASNEIAIIMSKYMSILTEKQLKHNFKVFEKENKKIQKRIEKYNTDLIIQRFEFFLGNLNQKQINIVNKHKDFFIKRNIRRLEQRSRLLGNLNNIFQTEKESVKKQKLLLTAYQEYNKETVEYFKSKETLATYQMAINVLRASNEKQKKRLQAKIKTAADWVNYFSKYEF